MKVLLWAIVVLAFIAWFMRGNKSLPREQRRHRKGPPPSGTAADAEPMVECAHCGMFIPASDSVAGPAGAIFCSEEHRRLGPGAGA